MRCQSPYYIINSNGSLGKDSSLPESLPLYAMRCKKNLIGGLRAYIDGTPIQTYSRIECSSIIGEYLLKVVDNSNRDISLTNRRLAFQSACEIIEGFGLDESHLQEAKKTAKSFLIRDEEEFLEIATTSDNFISIHCYFSTLALYDPNDAIFRHSATFDKVKSKCHLKRNVSDKIENKDCRSAFIKEQFNYDLCPYFHKDKLKELEQSYYLCESKQHHLIKKVYNRLKNEPWALLKGRSLDQCLHHPLIHFSSCIRELWLLTRSEEDLRKPPSEESLKELLNATYVYSILSCLISLYLAELEATNSTKCQDIWNELTDWSLEGYALILKSPSEHNKKYENYTIEYCSPIEFVNEEYEWASMLTYPINTPLGQAKVSHTEIHLDNKNFQFVNEDFICRKAELYPPKDGCETPSNNPLGYPVMGRINNTSRYLHISTTRPGCPLNEGKYEYDFEYNIDVTASETIVKNGLKENALTLVFSFLSLALLAIIVNNTVFVSSTSQLVVPFLLVLVGISFADLQINSKVKSIAPIPIITKLRKFMFSFLVLTTIDIILGIAAIYSIKNGMHSAELLKDMFRAFLFIVVLPQMLFTVVFTFIPVSMILYRMKKRKIPVYPHMQSS